MSIFEILDGIFFSRTEKSRNKHINMRRSENGKEC